MRPANILHLGVKELRSLLRDPVMVVLIVYAFTLSIYSAATAMPETLHKAPIAVVDEDRSQLSQRIIDAFYPPFFKRPVLITQKEMDARMDAGFDTFALNIPPGFQRDVLAGIGTVAGFFGVGGGLVIVPGLIYWAGFSQHKATGTSLAVLLPPIGWQPPDRLCAGWQSQQTVDVLHRQSYLHAQARLGCERDRVGRSRRRGR